MPQCPCTLCGAWQLDKDLKDESAAGLCAEQPFSSTLLRLHFPQQPSWVQRALTKEAAGQRVLSCKDCRRVLSRAKQLAADLSDEHRNPRKQARQSSDGSEDLRSSSPTLSSKGHPGAASMQDAPLRRLSCRPPSMELSSLHSTPSASGSTTPASSTPGNPTLPRAPLLLPCWAIPLTPLPASHGGQQLQQRQG
uniref:Uncharacterized protein n=1 Tax=Dunaliella tertiolecta TaxID=3047 RepID=A0A7S3QLZ0_DUNTE